MSNWILDSIGEAIGYNPALARPWSFMKSIVFVSILSLGLWAVFSLPAILFAGWFPLDLGGIFRIGKEFPANLAWIISPYNGSGRYFPFYWIYNSLQFKLFGTSVSPYYAVQSAVILLSIVLSGVLVQKLTASWRMAGLLIFLLYFSSPLSENINTLGKAEPVAFLLLMSIACTFWIFQIAPGSSQLKKRKFIFFVVFGSIAFALAMWTKETSIALFGFCIFGLVATAASSFLLKVSRPRELLESYGVAFAVVTIGMCIAKAPYYIFSQSTASATYTNYSITSKLIGENLTFYLQQQPDVFIFGMFALLLFGLIGKALRQGKCQPDAHFVKGYIFASSLLAMAWCYYLVLLVWRWPMAYYMLLPAFIFKFAAVYAFFASTSNGLLGRGIQVVSYSLIGACVAYAGFYSYYICTSQIAYSRVYTEALQKYVDIGDDNKRLIFESYPFYSEQIGGSINTLVAETGTEFRIDGVADVLDPAVTANAELLGMLGVSQAKLNENIDNLPRHGDYLVAITGNKLATWFLRGVTPYYSEDAILKIQGVYDLSLVAERSISTPAVYLNVWTNRLSIGETSIGYKLYKAISDEPKFVWRGRYPDGWIGKGASLRMSATYDKPVSIRFSAADFSLPNKLTIKEHGRLIEEVLLTDTNEKRLDLKWRPGTETEYEFEVQNVVVPKAIGFNKDIRELGLRLALDGTGTRPGR